MRFPNVSISPRTTFLFYFSINFSFSPIKLSPQLPLGLMYSIFSLHNLQAYCWRGCLHCVFWSTKAYKCAHSFFFNETLFKLQKISYPAYLVKFSSRLKVLSTWKTFHSQYWGILSLKLKVSSTRESFSSKNSSLIYHAWYM